MKRSERTPDTSTDSFLEDPQASHLGKAVMTLSFKLLTPRHFWCFHQLILEPDFEISAWFGSKLLVMKGTLLQGMELSDSSIRGLFFFLLVGKFSKIKRTTFWATLFHLYFFLCNSMEKSWSWRIAMVWFSDDLELFNYKFRTLTEMPYISTEGLFAHNAAWKAAFDSWSAGLGCLSTASSHLWVSLCNWHKVHF